MLHCFHARVGRVGVLLALLAIFMLFVAPIVSKTLVRQGLMMPEMGNMLMPGMAMAHSAHELSHEHAGEHPLLHQPLSQDTSPEHRVGAGSVAAQQASWMDDAACGYCQLLLHMPLIFWVAALILWCLITLRRIPAFVQTSTPAFSGWFRPFLARAPPVAVIH
ncbi:DUF2946 domain-containing protein [Mangrovibacter yixingensis]|uniref:DUF2946 domain-containing protein n=1 Tax=Mangrovibacter yixingensis TaxID=1529639 RepID=UPI001CFC2209|nr:DUF2946 domain-containing protein [Mangrovibacter yixingensis]